VWTPAQSAEEGLPVMVYFYGGGNVAGDGSEPRYDGKSMARQGIVTLTVNYRLNVFGFLAHPELTAESPRHASGNCGYLDQNAALRWVQQNIAAFGGDPARVTIAGESAGSISVCAHMVSPQSKGFFAGAIGESGALIEPTLPPVPLAAAEAFGIEFAESVGADSLVALRAIPATELLEATGQFGLRFAAVVGGDFLPKLPVEVLSAGEQAVVPLLVGWNSAEINYQGILGQEDPTAENFVKAVRALYGDRADQVLSLYPASTDEEARRSATALASDRFIAYSTWKWADLHSRTGGQPVYRYLYARPRPPMVPEMGDAVPGLAGGVIRGQGAEANRPPPAEGAVHSAEIEYALGNLDTNPIYAWEAEDYQVSGVMQAYFANFVKQGDPNGPGLPTWPASNQGDEVRIMRLEVYSQAEAEQHRERYLFHDQFYTGEG
jgi:para-nitrobenzyl esterase